MNVSSLMAVFNIFKPKSDAALTGLGGWLILVGLGIVASALKTAYDLIAFYGPFVAGPRFARLVDAGDPAHHPELAVAIAAEMGASVVLLALNLYVVWAFFAKRRAFVRAFVTLLIAVLAVKLAGLAAFAVLAPGRAVFDAMTVVSLTGSVFSLAVWGAYVRRSRRVRLTFTRP